MHLFDLSGRVAVVTGGSGVLGAALCHGLAQAGATVVVIARTAAKVEETTHAVRAAGGQALGIPADVLDRAQLERALDSVMQAAGRVDILVNAAGGNRPEATVLADQRPFFDVPREALEWVLDLNLMGTLLPSQVFGRVMAERKQGVIINISSMAAFTPLTRVVAYAAAKAAVNNFTQWLAVTMARDYSPAIRVNAIAPGFFLGDQNRYLLIDQATGDLTPRGRQIIDHTPMGRFGEPNDLIGTLVWLVSDAARFVTGVVVPVDGGFNAYSGV
jgi:NAD(P)-dependent dehydrogenase (short-subunit alcohol dehydrogenase family)